MNDKKTEDALCALRNQVDALDEKIVSLLNGRAQLALDIGQVKHASGQKIYAPQRERMVLQRISDKNTGPLPDESITLIYKEIISASLALEQPLQVAFVGPEASFTHQATKRHFGLSAQSQVSRTIEDVFDSVSRGRCAYGVVPVESSSVGAVAGTLDALVRYDLKICAEILLEVSHHLLTRSGHLDGINKIYGEAENIGSCRVWLDENLPGIPLIDVSTMGRAAELAASDASAAAIGTDLAGSIYGIRVATPRLDNTAGDLARFFVIGSDAADPTGTDRTSIVFALPDDPGVLFKVLEPLAKEGINMSRIESRPARGRAWDYMFFVDVEGHQRDPHIAAALKEMQSISVFFRILGSYPRGEL